MRKKPPYALYTADLHLGHSKIIDYCNRPFSSIEEMDQAIIANAQKRSHPKTHLWIVGDFAVHKAAAQRYFDAVPGIKHLIMGNHDPKWVRDFDWASVHDLTEFSDYNKRFVLCHYPMITWNKARYGSLQLFGHIHHHHQGSQKAINVGVDCWNFEPITARDILDRAKNLGPHPTFSSALPDHMDAAEMQDL